jgi:hypothetical protein
MARSEHYKQAIENGICGRGNLKAKTDEKTCGLPKKGIEKRRRTNKMKAAI